MLKSLKSLLNTMRCRMLVIIVSWGEVKMVWIWWWIRLDVPCNIWATVAVLTNPHAEKPCTTKASSVDQGSVGIESAGWLGCHVAAHWHIPTAICCIAVTLCTDAHGPRMMNPNVFGDPLTLSLVPSSVRRLQLRVKRFSFMFFSGWTGTTLAMPYISIWRHQNFNSEIPIRLSFTLCLGLISKC